MDQNSITQHTRATQGLKIAHTAARTLYPAFNNSGLASLQQSTISLMKNKSPKWGFANSTLNVQRHKISGDLWKLTVINPRTHEKILEAEGSGDTLFANEDNIARMAEAISQQNLKIRTNFD